MKTVIYTLFTIAWMLWLAEPTIKFKPFSISFASPLIPFAYLTLIVSIILFNVHSELKGYKEGYKKGQERTIELLDEIFREKFSKK